MSKSVLVILRKLIGLFRWALNTILIFLFKTMEYKLLLAKFSPAVRGPTAIKGPSIVPKNNLKASRVMRGDEHIQELLAKWFKGPGPRVPEFQGQGGRGPGRAGKPPSPSDLRGNGDPAWEPVQGDKMNWWLSEARSPASTVSAFSPSPSPKRYLVQSVQLMMWKLRSKRRMTWPGSLCRLTTDLE